MRSACHDKMMRSQRSDKPVKQSATSSFATSGSPGLVIDSLDNGQEVFSVDGCQVTVRRNWQKAADMKTGILELSFIMEKPARFEVAIKIPGNCLNACMTLNNQSLLGWFSDIFPESLPKVPASPCAGGSDHVTPLKPGRLQTLNFRWQNGDQLKMIVVLA